MFLNDWKYRGPFFLVLLLLGLSVGCTVGKTEEALKKRVSQYWESRAARDWKGVYDMLTPDERAVITFDNYLSDKRSPAQMKIDSYEIQKVQIDGERGESTVKYTWKIELPVNSEKRIRTGSNMLQQKWRYQDGNWYVSQ
jgi:hypothetical protein